MIGGKWMMFWARLYGSRWWARVGWIAGISSIQGELKEEPTTTRGDQADGGRRAATPPQ